ncbi:hypothetical protein ACFU76_33365 [Streptomyces sp. NPDC057539]|uniref:hypothetical protein n=1 Tax=Streptomyces sp. NPDC057539 TaxID=3346159 RepID=UPI0036AF5CC6
MLTNPRRTGDRVWNKQPQSQALDLNQARSQTISWSGPHEAEPADEGQQANGNSDRMDQEKLPRAREQEA